jgi:hypothetical protein
VDDRDLMDDPDVAAGIRDSMDRLAELLAETGDSPAPSTG